MKNKILFKMIESTTCKLNFMDSWSQGLGFFTFEKINLSSNISDTQRQIRLRFGMANLIDKHEMVCPPC